MFKLFNKSQTSSSKSPQTHPTYPKEVLEIHHEFETAAEKLLDQAKQCITEAESKDVVKISRLQSLGFKQAAQVVDIEPVLKKAELSREQIELIKYYKQNYPFNKFITEEQVKEICYKYNLICGDVSRFKGFVPEKNLREIEKFKLKTEDEFGNIVIFIEKTGKIENLNWSKITNIEEVKWIINVYLKTNDYTFMCDHSTYPKYTRLVNRKLYNDEKFKIQESLQLSLQICAPVKDMDISGLELTEGYKLTKKHVPDPVVLQPVKGGYLILTAWGDEASDPIVVNEIMN